MKKMKKIFVSLLMTLVLAVSAFPMEVSAASPGTASDDTVAVADTVGTEEAEDSGTEKPGAADAEESSSAEAEESSVSDTGGLPVPQETVSVGTSEEMTGEATEKITEEFSEKTSDENLPSTEAVPVQEESSEDLTGMPGKLGEEAAIPGEQGDGEDAADSTAAVHPTIKTVPLDGGGVFDISAEAVSFGGKKALLIQDTIPWATGNSSVDSNQEVLKQIVPYDVVLTSKFHEKDVSDYAVIIFANDQEIETYENYVRVINKMTDYVEHGGVIVFGAADGGWAHGKLHAPLPGGVTKTSEYQYQNYIVDEKHPIVTGQLTGGAGLTNDDLYSTYCSHAYFNKESLPAGTNTIFRDGNGNPTMIEYPLGRGRIIASGLTWEHNYVFANNNIHYRPFAPKAMKDYYTYALYISGGNNDNLAIMFDGTVKEGEHLVLVADAVTKNPIKGASVSLGSSTLVTDEDGRAWFKGVVDGDRPCTLKKDGYQTKRAYYNVKGASMRYFFMTPKKGSDFYMTGAWVTVTETDGNGKKDSKTYDLLQDRINIEKQKKYQVELGCDWNGQKAGWYVLCNDTQAAYSKDGKFVFEDGKCSNSNGAVVEFKDGRIYACMISKEEKRSRQEDILLYAGKSSGGGLFGKDNGGLVSIGKEIGFKVPGNCPIIGNMDLSISLDSIPVCYEVSGDEIKIAIGIEDFAVFKNPKTSWEDYRKKVETAKRTKNLAEINKAFGAKPGTFTLKNGWETALGAVGYAVGKFDGATGEISGLSGGLVMSSEMMYRYNQQFVVGPAPVYFEIGGGITIENAAQVKGVLTDVGRLVLDDSLTLTPKFVIGGGVGVNGALSASADGEVSLPVVLFKEKPGTAGNPPRAYANISLAGEMKLKASLLFVFGNEKSINRGEWQVLRCYYDTGEIEMLESDELDALAAGAGLTDVSSYSLSPRDYLENAGRWYTENLEAVEYVGGMTTLKRGILDTSAPQITKLDGDRALMVFQDDVPSRGSINRSRLMYSLFENGAWGEPQPVWDDGCADMAASVATGSCGTYVVWQKASSKLQDSATAAQLAAVCEIAVAKYDADKKSFFGQKRLTNGSQLRMMPVAVVGEDDAYALYVENSGSNLLGGGTYTIKAQNLVSGKEQILHSGSAYVTSLDGKVSGGKLSAAYILDRDGDMSTMTDTDVYCKEGGFAEERITNDEAAQLNVQYCGDMLYWYQNGSNAVYCYDGSGSGVAAAADVAIGTNFKMMESGGKLAITWIGVTAEGKDCIFAKTKKGGEWSGAVSIVVGDDLKQFDGYIGSGGSWEFVAVTDGGGGDTRLLYSGTAPHLKTSVSNIAVTERSGDEMYYRLTADFSNQSEQTLGSLKVDFLRQDKVEYSRTVRCNIKSGERKKLNFDIDLPVQKRLADYTVRIYPEGERDLTDNEGAVNLGYTDIAISLDRYESGNVNILTANIYNDSDVAGDVTLTVREDDAAKGIIADMVNIKALESGKTRTFSYSYNLAMMDFNGKASKTYYYIVTSSLEESDKANNMVSVTLPNPYYTKNGMPANPKGISVNAPDPVILRMDAEKTYKIEAEATPKSASRWPLKYTSSDTAVVKIDEEGVVHAVSAGRAKVTVQAVDTQVEKEITVIVEEVDKNAMFMELEDRSEKPSKGYQVNDKWQIRVCSKKSEGSLDGTLFTYESDNASVASVDVKGMVAFNAPGKATLTATYKKKQSIKVSKAINVENEKTGTITLKYIQGGKEHEAGDIYAAIKERPEIILLAECYAENGNRLAGKKPVFASSNRNVAAVDGSGKVSVTGREGVTVLSAKDKETGVFAEMTLCIFDTYTPQLISNTPVTVNVNSSEGTLAELMPTGKRAISGFDKRLYTKDGKGNYAGCDDFAVNNKDMQNNEIVRESGAYGYRITASPNAKAGTYYMKTYSGEDSYYIPIKISVDKKKPNVTVSIQKFNTFITDECGIMTINADAQVKDVTIVEVNRNKTKLGGGFALGKDASGRYVIRTTSDLREALSNGTRLGSYNHEYRVSVQLAGYTVPVEANVKIPAQYTVPSAKLSTSSFIADLSGSRNAMSTLSIKDVGAKEYSVNLSGVTLDVEMNGLEVVTASVEDTEKGLLRFLLPRVLPGKKTGRLMVKKGNWVSAVPVSVSVTGKTNPACKLDRTANVNVVTVVPSTVNLVISGGQSIPLKEAVPVSDNLFKIVSGSNGVTVTPIANPGEYTKNSYKYDLELESEDNQIPKGNYRLNISINRRNVLQQASSKLYLDVSQRGRMLRTKIKGDAGLAPYDLAKTEITIKNSKNVDSTNISVELKSDGTIEITGQQKIAGEYKVVITPILANGAKMAPVKYTVVAGKDTKVAASASGALDAMKRTKSISTVSLKVEKNSSAIENVTIENASRSSFEILSSDLGTGIPRITIGIKSGINVKSGAHKIPLCVTLGDGMKVNTAVDVKVTSSQCKLVGTNNCVMSYSMKPMCAYGTIKVQDAANPGIVSIAQTSAASQFRLVDDGGGNFRIYATGKSAVKKGTYKINCNVAVDGQASDAKPIPWQVSVTVK